MLIMMMLTALFPSCGHDPSEGEIGDVEIETPSDEEKPAGTFKKLESPFDYEYEPFTIRKAHMTFDVPSSWENTLVNSRYARLEAPVTDDLFPGATVNILCGYGEDVDENEMSEYTLNNHAYRFSDFFCNELEGLTYNVDGRLCRLRQYVTEDHIENGLAFVDSDHVEDAATLIADEVAMVDKATNYYTGNSFVATYVKWNHCPFCFSMVVPKESAGDARKILEYIASSITYPKAESIEYGEVSYGDVSTSVPTHFMPVTGAENIFASSLEQNKETAGMAVGIFRVENSETINEENIAKYYGETIAAYTFNGYNVPVLYAAQAWEGSDGPDYAGEITINATGENPATVAGSVFGPLSYYKVNYYVKEDDGAAYLIAVIYQKGQEDIAKKVGETALRKLRIN